MTSESDQATASRSETHLAEASIPKPRTELTARAILMGCMLGAILAAGNVYSALKTGYVDGGSITAAVVAFALLSRKRGGARPYSVAENNLTQTIASSAAVMSFVTGVTGPVAALSLMGRSYPFLIIALWGTALGTLGVAIARTLRERLIVIDELPFPTGRATGEIIETMHGSASRDLGRAKVLLWAAVAAALITWFRDGKPVFIPQALTLPWGHAALAAASLWLGASVSPVMVAAGILIGPRGGASVLLGTVSAWGLLAPAVLAAGFIAKADYLEVNGWLLWPGVTLLVSSALTAFLMEWRTIVRGARDLLKAGRAGDERAGEAPTTERRFWMLVTAASVVVIFVTGFVVLEVNPLMLLLALAFAFLMAGVCARAAGETDLAPTGSAGALGQLLFGAPSAITSLFCGSVILGSASQTAQTMWAFKAGHRLKASPHVQALGQLLGLVVGALVVVPIFTLVTRAYGLGTPVMPAPGATTWKATAEAVQLGTSALPPGAGVASLIAFMVGVALTLLGRTRAARYLPSAVPLGIAFLIPAPLGGAIFLGGMAFAVLRSVRPKWTDQYVPSLAAGAIAGESLTGIVIAALLAAGFLG
jgi:putative OPT family oligopeptide transporter